MSWRFLPSTVGRACRVEVLDHLLDRDLVAFGDLLDNFVWECIDLFDFQATKAGECLQSIAGFRAEAVAT